MPVRGLLATKLRFGIKLAALNFLETVSISGQSGSVRLTFSKQLKKAAKESECMLMENTTNMKYLSYINFQGTLVNELL